MSAPKLLIPFSFVTEATGMSDKITDVSYRMALKIAQEDLRDILGGEFYEEIETQYSPTADTFTTANATLYEDYLKDYLAWATYQRYLGFGQSLSTPTGLRTFTDENSSIATDLIMSGVEKNVKAMVSRYKDKIINYLRLQRQITSTAFPLWVDECREEFGWGITCIERDSYKDKIISITKATRGNE